MYDIDSTLVRQRNIQKLKSKHYDGSDDDWANIIKCILIPHQTNPVNEIRENGLQVSCSVSGKDPNTTLLISFRHQIEEITQRIGTIELRQTEETDGVDLFGWAAHALEERDHNARELIDRTGKLESAKATIASLEKKLDELTQAKEEHETQLIWNFASLLNEKKLRIRELQAMLVSDLDTADQDQVEAKTSRRLKKAKKGGTRKRLASASPEPSENVDNETMDVDTGAGDERNVNMSRSTSRANTSATETESEGEDQDPAMESHDNVSAHTRQADKTLPAPKQSGRGKEGEKEKAKSVDGSKPTASIPVDDNPGPEESEDTASEDDEL